MTTPSTHAVLQRDNDNRSMGLAVGGPYQIEEADDILVGDLWLLAGQSNMEGVGDLRHAEEPSPWVRSFQSREEWAPAEEPLHWLGEFPRFIHHQLWGRERIPDAPDPRDPERLKGAGLGLSFGKQYYHLTGVPVGLIPSAHGGTSMSQWNPKDRDKGGDSLYGASYQRFLKAGGKIKGILWYQGESDANPSDAAFYTERMIRLIQAFRVDFGQPTLPFYLVQLGRFVSEPLPENIQGWNAIREAQRLLPTKIEQTACVSAIDLELDDPIHIGVQGLKRLGRRLARVAAGGCAPELLRAEQRGETTLCVKWGYIAGSLHAPGRAGGFSLRDAQDREIPLIYKTTLEGDSCILHLGAWSDAMRDELRLWYGYGLDPYCNITDGEDQSLPSFGPIQVSLPEGNRS